MYQRLLDSITININMTSVDFGSTGIQPKDTIVACVGTRKNPTAFRHEFPAVDRNSINHTWQFRVNNPQCASFVVVLFKRRFLGGDKEIGEIHLRCSAFEVDTVVSHTFELDTPTFQSVKPKVSLDVHLNTTSAQPFFATPGKLDEDFKVEHPACMFS